MPSRVFSTFGTYDFFGKSIPGMALIAGLFLLVPEQLRPEIDLAESVVVILGVTLLIILLGVLFGEIVHSIAKYIEKVLYLVGRWVRNCGVNRGIGPPEKPTGVQMRETDDDGDGETDAGTDEDTLPEKIKYTVWRWLYAQYEKLFYIFSPHRRIFLNMITEELDHDLVTILDESDASFERKPLIDMANEDFDVGSPDDPNAIYPVVVSYALHAGCERPFRYQARYAFCRSMSVVLVFLAVLFGLVAVPETVDNIPWTGIELDLAAIESAYILEITSRTLILTSILLVVIGVIFGGASGAYKKHYVKYLIAEFYVIREMNVLTDHRDESTPNTAT